MARGAYRVLPLGDTAAYVEFARTLDLKVNATVQRLARALAARVQEAREAGRASPVRDVVPALGGVALHFDVEAFEGDLLAHATEMVEACLREGLPPEDAAREPVDVPVCYEPPFAPDLPEVAERRKLDPAEVARLHASAEYRVLMIGFAPGHAYMSGLPAALSVPRRANPRAAVPGGSVAIANEQTVVYPYEISGGWSVIGRTPLAVFDAAREQPSLFLPGDRVRFHAISAEEYAALAGDAP